MLVAIKNDSEKGLAWETERDEGPFTCPGCNREAVIKKGRKKSHHFAHKQKHDCTYGLGESDVHYKCKREIYEALLQHPSCTFCEMEKPLEGVRPDIYGVIRDTKVAIEVQKTIITPEDVRRRSRIYAQLDVHVFWFMPERPKPIKAEERVNSPHSFLCRPNSLEQAFNSMYGSRIYYWAGGLEFFVYHFKDVERLIPEYDLFDEEGETQCTVGGYYEKYKQIKYADGIPGETRHLTQDFAPAQKNRLSIWQATCEDWWRAGSLRI